jgi:hypothetical protein
MAHRVAPWPQFAVNRLLGSLGALAHCFFATPLWRAGRTSPARA